MDTKKTLIALVIIYNIVSLIEFIMFGYEFVSGMLISLITYIISLILLPKTNKIIGQRTVKASLFTALSILASTGTFFTGLVGYLIYYIPILSYAYLIGYIPILSIIPLLNLYNKAKDNQKEPTLNTPAPTDKNHNPTHIFNPTFFICPICQTKYLENEFNNHCKWCGAKFNREGNVTGYTKPFFRIFKNTTTIRQYNTLTHEDNNMFLSYIFNNFGDCDIKTRVSASEIAENAPEYAMPINFLITKDGKRVAVLLIESKKEMRYSLLETVELCNENNITPLKFVFGFPNEEGYIVNRIRKGLDNTLFNVLDKTIKRDASKEGKNEEWNFRNIKGITNIKIYDTLSHEINHKFLSYIFNNFAGYDIKTRVSANTIAENAPEYAMPINFLITKDEKRVAILLINSKKCKRYSVLETMELCKENNVIPLRFIIEFPNEEKYVVDRIKATFEESAK